MEQLVQKLDAILSNLFDKYSLEHVSPGVLLSGGIDSSTISYYVSQYAKKYTLLSMGTETAKDKPFVERMSRFLDHEYQWVEIVPSIAHENKETVCSLLAESHIETNLMQVSLAMGYFLVFKKAKSLGITHIVTGQGPDVLFAGYHKYKESKDINSDIKKDLPLLEIDKKRDGAMAAYFGITLVNPYLEKEVVDFSLSVPAEYKIHNGIEKYILRRLAATKGLPDAIINRPKKAFQYSTGIQRMMRDVL